jgi:hypothetical protein
MDEKEFGPSMTGRLVGIQNLHPDVRFAFVPNPLPPQWNWPERLWPLLLEARTCLASLDGTGKHLLNPEILQRFF